MKKSEIMSRARFVRHRGKMILTFDFSRLDIDAAREVCSYVKGVISRMPKGSVLTLVDVTDVKYDAEFRELSGALAEHNKPYVRAGAVVGVDGWKKLLFWTTEKLTGRKNLRLFTDVEQAKDWLVGQAG